MVRFDPWLVSGRNDLIAEFLGEVIGTVNADEARSDKYRELGATVAEYGAHLAPAANLFLPGVGALLSGGLHAAKKALTRRGSLAALRARLIAELRMVAVPIVVLIDEIDRIEDDEIRSIAQLVRSVADFPGVSYVLAYDADRVIQALGNGNNERGRAYLEKIVQLQIPLPVTFADEIARLLIADLTALQTELRLPENFQSIERYQELLRILIECVLSTPRDVRRLVGTFHVLAAMVQAEVDWIDTLAYSALLIKAPATVAHMHRDPDIFLGGSNSVSYREIAAAMDREKMTVEQRLKKVVPEVERNDGTEALLELLFPTFSDRSSREREYPDGLRERRPLLTILRLGLIPGAYSREEIEQLVTGSPEQIRGGLQKAFDSGKLVSLTDRLDDLYVELPSIDHKLFWQGVAAFVRKPDCEWMTSYQQMNEAMRSLAVVFERAVQRRPQFRPQAVEVFRHLQALEEQELTPHWLRRHIHTFGLFGNEARGGERWFLERKDVMDIAKQSGSDWRSKHLLGQFIPCHWDLQTAYTMIDTGAWDEPCQTRLDETLTDQRALDGFTLMLFGGPYVTDRKTIQKMCDLDLYLRRVRERVSSGHLHETVRVALRKATGEDI